MCISTRDRLDAPVQRAKSSHSPGLEREREDALTGVQTLSFSSNALNLGATDSQVAHGLASRALTETKLVNPHKPAGHPGASSSAFG